MYILENCRYLQYFLLDIGQSLEPPRIDCLCMIFPLFAGVTDISELHFGKTQKVHILLVYRVGRAFNPTGNPKK